MDLFLFAIGAFWLIMSFAAILLGTLHEKIDWYEQTIAMSFIAIATFLAAIAWGVL